MRYLHLLIILIISPIMLNAYTGNISMEGMKNEKRLALVIGNNQYETFGNLKNPVNDAKALKEILEKRDFKVIYRTNATKRELREAVDEFTKKLKKDGGVGLFFFAGHGIQVDGINYLIASNSDFTSEEDVDRHALSVNRLIRKMKNAKNRLNIIILDACRNNPFDRGSSGGLAAVSNARGMFIAYATEAGGVTKDGVAGGNGIFTKYLIKHIQEEGLSIEEVFKRVRRDVYRATNGKQSPGVYNQILGDFYFTLPKNLLATFKLDIKTVPKDAKVELVNVGKVYHRGMKLKRGNYTIRVSKDGYITKEGDIDLQQNISIRIVLDENTRGVNAINNALAKWDKSIFQGKRSYSQKGKHTVKDNLTNLIWQASDDGKKRTWKDAINYCKNLELDGITNWRLPTFNELYYLADRNRFKPAIDTRYFKARNSSYWTSTEYKNDLTKAWHIFFDDGGDFYNRKSNKVYVRCVASGH